MTFICDLSDVLLMIILGFWVLRRETKKVKYCFHHVISRVYQDFHDARYFILEIYVAIRKAQGPLF